LKGYSANKKMESYNIYGEQNGYHSTMYPRGDGNGSISDAPTIAKGDQGTLEAFDEALGSYQAKNRELDKVYAVVKEYCAIGRGPKKAEDGRQASEHTRAERMVVGNFGEKDIKTIRVVLAAHGIYAADMTDIDAMGIPDPDGHYRHTDDWKSNDRRTEYKPAAHCPIWVHEDQASSRNTAYEVDPLEALKKKMQTPTNREISGRRKAQAGTRRWGHTGCATEICSELGRWAHSQIPSSILES
jgi:hypothetical protein